MWLIGCVFLRRVWVGLLVMTVYGRPSKAMYGVRGTGDTVHQLGVLRGVRSVAVGGSRSRADGGGFAQEESEAAGQAWRSAGLYSETEEESLGTRCDWCGKQRRVAVWMGWQCLCRLCWLEAQREWYDDSEGRTAR